MPVLVVDHVGHRPGVGAAAARGVEVDPGAVPERVARARDVDGGRHRVVGSDVARLDRDQVIVDDAHVVEGVALGVLRVGPTPDDVDRGRARG